MRTVELLPDEATDDAVRAEWDRLAAAGLASAAAHEHPTHRPHLTLAEAEEMDDALASSVGHLLADALPLPSRLGALAVFPSRRGAVLVRAVVPSPDLVALHADVARLLADAGCALRPHLLPGAWTPHLTLALRMPVEQVGDAVALLLTREGEREAGWAGARSYTSDERVVTDLLAGLGACGP